MPIKMTAPLIDPAALETCRRVVTERMERASLRTVDTIARRGQAALRDRMAGAGLGRLGNAIGANADQKLVRQGGDRFSTSARFFPRTRSERTLGALAAYTSGADIAPTRGRWLWISTDAIPRFAGRQRMTPALWRERGFDKKIGPLRLIRSVNGRPLLVVDQVGVDLSGRKGKAKSLTKAGAPRKGQVRKELIVAFVGIPRTARAARINVTSILESVRAEMPAILANELQKEAR